MLTGAGCRGMYAEASSIGALQTTAKLTGTASSDPFASQIKRAGAIDNEAIREEIMNVTEGGRHAFKLRMDKYGF